MGWFKKLLRKMKKRNKMIKLQTIVELLRLEENYQYGTFGILRIDKQVFCVTLEPKDEENATDISSIPAQQYVCKRTISPRFGETFEITGVPDRFNVLFHAGNTDEDTEGCVILAEHYGKLGKNRAILNSGNTFKKFMLIMEGIDEFLLTIIEIY
ncbi:hypothetical protein LCGC14_1057540 [marine sediment metagenome]|uniref:DUF5675 domain-containing protein n=1 Tax=marine sediment metagenome TaxID=412755 RepID=A0A0F9QT31_9ZZZZ